MPKSIKSSTRAKRMSRRSFLALSGSVGAGVLLFGVGAARAHTAKPLEVTNALEHRAYDEIHKWGEWLRTNGARGYIGEISLPNSLEGRDAEDVQKWMGLLDRMYAFFRDEGFWVTAFCATRAKGTEYAHYTGVPLSASWGNRTIGEAHEQAAIVEAHVADVGGMRGIHINGAQMGETYIERGDFTGGYGTAWYYPDADDFAFVAARGYKLARLPIRWERIQPTINKALSSTELTRTKTMVADCAAAGMRPILDIHNYGGRFFEDGSHAKIGTSKLPVRAFTNLWSRLAAAFKGNTSMYGFDLMNEPGDLPGTQAEAVLLWEDASRQAVNAIRNQRVGKVVMVPGYHQHGQGTGTGLPKFTGFHSDGWITDSNFLYTAHWYVDNGGIRPPNGSAPGGDGTYDEDNTYWAARGY